jgi:hypothetical protein
MTTKTETRVGHTPGPWTLEPKRKVLVGADGFTEIAQCFVRFPDGSRFREGEANAHLLKVAPEMLTALELLYLSDLDDAIEKYIPYPERVEYRMALITAGKAIARAKGERP